MKANCGNPSLELEFVNIRGVCFLSFKLKGEKIADFSYHPFLVYFVPLRVISFIKGL
jgi:hypothetical protein